ncbi:hypothetical protein BK648_23455 [Pseudomonas poae]|uniref:Uncharacterized protein n=1 Tax=Pseudomonas poae TaxID=200451 RepID=A0A423ER01_9PSED|nr:hypothetical protein [Pseudomonas poae]ROM33739.1 hypothetical protein BK648_23455 [Pseudomonas poae]
MKMYFNGNEFIIAATERLGPEINEMQGFDFAIKGVIADGVTRTYNFPADATGVFWAYERYWGTPYSATGGSLSLSLDSQDRLVGTFSFTGSNGNRSVQVSRGAVDLSGFITEPLTARLPEVTGTGYMDGTVVGGPAPDPTFSATMVTARKIQDPLGSRDYFQVIGRQWDDDIAQTQSLILIVVPVGTTGTRFELSRSSEVRVTYGRVNAYAFAYAISGWITFTSMPETGRAAGSLDCMVQRNEDPPFAIKVNFDISDPVRQP